jgi:hypothetical protein
MGPVRRKPTPRTPAQAPIDKVLIKIVMEQHNAIRVLNGQSALTVPELKAWFRAQLVTP